jgi:hypothetical protein
MLPLTSRLADLGWCCLLSHAAGCGSDEILHCQRVFNKGALILRGYTVIECRLSIPPGRSTILRAVVGVSRCLSGILETLMRVGALSARNASLPCHEVYSLYM